MAYRFFDAAFAALLCAASIYLWFVADALPVSQRFAQADADFWPKAILAVIAVLTAIIAYRGVRRGLAERASASGSDPSGRAEWFATARRIAIMGALILAYFWAFQTFGFPLATFAFLCLASYAIPYHRHWPRFAFAAAFTIGLTVFFTRALGLPLPRGTGPFYDVNLIFY